MLPTSPHREGSPARRFLLEHKATSRLSSILTRTCSVWTCCLSLRRRSKAGALPGRQHSPPEKTLVLELSKARQKMLDRCSPFSLTGLARPWRAFSMCHSRTRRSSPPAGTDGPLLGGPSRFRPATPRRASRRPNSGPQRRF